MTNIRRRTLLAGAAGSLVAVNAIRRAEAQATTIRIGGSWPLSGALEPVGKPGRIGAEAAVERLNRLGGVAGKKIEMVLKDDKGDPNQAVANLREFNAEGVKQVVGLPMTATAFAAAPLLVGLDISLITTGTPDEKLTHELYSPNYFQGAENTFTRCNAFAEAMTKRYPNVTTWTAALMDAGVGRDYWARAKHSLTAAYKKNLNKEVKFGEEQFIKLNGNDFKVQISQLMAQDMKGIFIVVPGAAGITFYQQAKQVGLDKKFTVLSDQGLDIDVAKALKGNTPTNLWISSYWYYDAFKNIPESNELAKTIMEKTGELPHGFSSLAYIGMEAWAAAIGKTGGDQSTAKVNAALAGMPLKTIRGPAAFRKEDHQLIGWTSLFSVKPKSTPPGFETADTIALDTANLVNPPAPGQKWELS